MGNCTSKKSRKSLKLSAIKKPFPNHKMDKDQDTLSKGLSKKVAPFTKGEVTSFGFKKKLSSQLPVPITLTSNKHSSHDNSEKIVQNGTADSKILSDGYQSGSSIESLCHAQYRSTPKMVRKSRDTVKQIAKDSVSTETEYNSVQNKSQKPTLNGAPSLAFRNENGHAIKTNPEATVNRFGFRQPTPPRATNNFGKSVKCNGTSLNARAAFLGSHDYETNSYTTNKKSEVSSRSRSEGPREAFFKQNLQPANSAQSGLNQSRTSLITNFQPGKFTFQTSHLPRPQYAVRMSEPKTTKTAVNYYRKGENRSDSNPSTNEDSGFESHPSANSTFERQQIEILESSPGSKVRRRLPAFKGKKLEMKIVGNKFELLKKDEQLSPDVVTEISLIKLPSSNIRNSTAIINTGLVEQRANQYLKKISQPFIKKDVDEGVNDPNRILSKINSKVVVDFNNRDEGLGAESEEEKLFKDSKKSEKSSLRFSMSDGCGDGEDMLPGETMAEDMSLCLSFEEEPSSECTKKVANTSTRPPVIDITPNTIRLDALKLSKELKYKTNLAGTNRKCDNSTAEFLAAFEKDEDTFPSDSILEQLSDSDSLGDKGENKNNDKEKNIKISNLDKEDLGIDLDEEDNSKSDATDIDENDLELNIDETEAKDDNKNCLGTNSPESPGTPTHASNSLSLSDGRDFLIDDEIADQPQLCMSESYVDCSCKEEAKTANEKTVTVNNDFVTCCDVQTNTVELEGRDDLPKEQDEYKKPNLEVKNNNFIREEKRRNSEGTLSPCESITSDDLMLDFETNSLDETAGRFDNNENISVENLGISISKDDIRDMSCQRLRAESGGEKSLKTKGGASNCSTPASAKSLEVVCHLMSSPYRSSRSTPADDESIKLDKLSYQNMFQDIIGIKAMLLKLKGLLLESEGGLLENGRIYPDNGTIDNVMEDELADLRRQVLFLQQQLEEREKMVQVLRLKISQSTESETVVTDTRKQSNAATQTGLDQFQQDFPHFRVFQTTPVV